MAEDKTSDELTERDIEDLNDPDDNPDVADADATEHNLRRAVIICFIVTSVMCLCINIVVLLMLQRKGKLDKAAANLDEFKENMQHLASDKSRQIARNKDVRKAMDTISQHIREIPRRFPSGPAHMGKPLPICIRTGPTDSICPAHNDGAWIRGLPEYGLHRLVCAEELHAMHARFARRLRVLIFVVEEHGMCRIDAEAFHRDLVDARVRFRATHL